MMASGSAAQMKGFGFSLVSWRKRLMAAWRSTMPLKTPRLSRCRVSLAKKPSTALSQEAEVGVKWKWNRLWRPEPGLGLTDRPLRQGGADGANVASERLGLR